MPDAEPRKRRVRIRPWLRAIHRDAGYFIIGLTLVYALSGLAVNHIGQWDPNFEQIDRTHQLTEALPDDASAAAASVLRQLGIDEAPSDVYAEGDQLDVILAERTLHVNPKARTVLEEGQEPRFFLRLANWLHLNRGKEAWTFIADGYAVILLYLATSGLFMLPGRKGLAGRGAVIATLGALVPVLYVTLSGGP